MAFAASLAVVTGAKSLVAYAAYAAGILLLWYISSWLLRVKGKPVGYALLPTPTRYGTVYGRRFPAVGGVLSRRMASRWFRWKAQIAARSLANGPQFQVRPLSTRRRLVRQWLRTQLARLPARSEYYLLKPEYPFRVGAYACSAGPTTQDLVLGIEPWLTRWFFRRSLLTASAADHELMHCVQDIFRQIFSAEWTRTLRYRDRLWYESQALLLGGPLVTFAFVVLAFWPLLMYPDVWVTAASGLFR